MSPTKVPSASAAAPRTEAGPNGSERMLERARRALAGGDSSSMRVLPYAIPLVAESGTGCRIRDVDGHEYLDLNMAYGPLLFGHRPAHVIEAVVRQISERGSQLGFPTEITVRAAEKLQRLFPGMELLRFANSGTEACASAVRLARTFTGRKKLVMFEGHYHGWSEAVFTKYHAPLERLPAEGFGPALPGTLGMSGSLADVVTVRWNDVDALARCLAVHGAETAAVMMEPVMGNGGVQLPRDGYLQTVREMAHDRGALLIFDEVITGLRVAAGGAQEHYLVTPDVTVVSKAIGGGYPVAAFGASRAIMETIVRGELFHGGVFSGNAASMAAVEAVLDAVLADAEGIYRRLHALADRFAAGMRELLVRLGVPHHVHHLGPLLSLLPTVREVPEIADYRGLREHGDFERYVAFQHELQRSGVFFHPNLFEPMFLSTAHTEADIDEALDRMEQGARRCLVR